MAALELSHARTVIRASDPDLGRFRMGARALMAAVASALGLTALAKLAGVPSRLALLGIDVAILGSLMVSDPEPRAQRTTQLLVPVIAAAATALGTVLAPYHLLSSLAFLVIIFGAVIVRRFGPRGVALGMIAFVTYFIALFFHMPARALPLALGGVALGGVIAYVVRFAMVVDRPVSIVRGLRKTLLRSSSLVVEQLARCAEGRRGDIKRALRRLNDVALVLEDQLDSPLAGGLPAATVEELRTHAFEVEVGSERVATAVAGFGEASHAIVPLLRRAARAMCRDDLEKLELDLEVAAIQAPDERARQRVQISFHDLLAGAQRLWAVRIEPAAVPREVPARHPPPPEPGLHPSTRQAIQATLAGGLAMIAGTMISSARWYWAVIAAFVMFTRTTTRGETVVRGVERVVGTAAGVLLGVWLGSWFAGHSRVELVIVFACVFVSYYFLQASYAGMVLALTLLLAALYGLLGRFTPGILYLRLAETLAGCVIGAVVAVFVLPASTQRKLRSGVADVLHEMASMLEERFAATPPVMRERARAIDRKLRDLRIASRPLVGPFMQLGSQRPAQMVHLVGTAWHFARPLALRADVELPAQAQTILQDVARRVAADARAITDGRPAGDAGDALVRARDTITGAGLLGAGPASPRAAIDWLARVASALRELSALTQGTAVRA